MLIKSLTRLLGAKALAASGWRRLRRFPLRTAASKRSPDERENKDQKSFTSLLTW
jgi:hypothetical protein